MRDRVSDRQAWGIFGAGIAILGSAFALSLYAVPSEVPGLPSFPLLSLPVPLISMLVALGAAFVAIGWIFHPRGSLGRLLTAAAVVFAVGVILTVASFLNAIPFTVDGMTIFVEPYAAHASLVLTIGPLLAFFAVLFWALDRLEKQRVESRRTRTSEE